MDKKTSVNSEEFIFYIDLITDFIKKKNIIKAIGNFIREKAKFNTLSSYGLLIFQKDDNPVTLYEETDFETISELINEKWETKETERSFFENGLFEILAYVFRKSRDARKDYRIIILSDTPSTLSADYHNALYDLLIKAKKFDTFIDIIRVGDEKFYNDDVKLKVVTSETHGGVLYCNDAKSFLNIIVSLIQSKSEFSVVQTDANSQILKEDKIFYEKLAVDLISLDSDEEEKCDICEKEVCPICSAYSDEVHKCFNCNVRYHACCAADYSISNNIGFNHVFRCIQCDTLLKLDEEYVDMIYEEEYEEQRENELISPDIIEESIEEDPLEENLIEDQVIEEQVVEEDYNQVIIGEGILNPEKLKSPPSLSKPPSIETPSKKVRVGGFFGQVVTVKPNSSNNNLVSSATGSVEKLSEGSTHVEEKLSITTLRPPRRSTVKLCKMCGQTLIGTSTCTKCGFKN
ncbi:MAG: VWA domain-containing protein [Candidatus Lokiarchaeota archaeon]|nr:VWA domain-containing protein [Candidatus Lokiarchaeota archaeon]